jgi:nitrate/TMAO reductase-like tetraheme cytochrome c subunit
VHVDAAALARSPHAGLACVQCHRTATVPHDATLPRVRCADCHPAVPRTLAGGAHGGPAAPACTACHGTHDVKRTEALGAETCAACHATQVAAYADSIHGRARQAGDGETPTCVSCHGGSVHAVRPKSDPASPVYPLRLPQTCAGCHANSELARRHGIKAGNVYQLYMDSIHGRALSRSGLLVAANCSDCHTAHAIKPKTDRASTVFPANVPATCGRCHAGILAEYARSVHGEQQRAGNAGAPVCTDCHSAHEIRRADAPPWQLEVVRECGSCHEESLRTYRDTFHGRVTQLGGGRVAKCADCHGAHDILPASNAASRVSSTRIVATCRQCHPAANFAFTQFHPHADPHNRERFPILYWVWLGMTALLAGTFGFFGLHTLLWLPRSLVERLRRRRDEGPAA